MSQRIDDDLKSRLQRGRGSAIRQLLDADANTASQYLMGCLCAPIDDPGMTCQVSGFVETILHHHLDLSLWQTWFANLPADASEEDLLFHTKLLAGLAEEDYAGCWESLLRQMDTWPAWRVLASEARGLLPAEAWLRVLPRMSDNDIRDLYERGDKVWFRLARMSPRVAKVLPQAVEAMGSARRPFGAKAYADAPSSQSRFVFLRDALISGDPPIDKELVEGLWDAHPMYRDCCAEFVAIDCDEVRDRLAVLAQDRWSPVARTARRRLRPV